MFDFNMDMPEVSLDEAIDQIKERFKRDHEVEIDQKQIDFIKNSVKENNCSCILCDDDISTNHMLIGFMMRAKSFNPLDGNIAVPYFVCKECNSRPDSIAEVADVLATVYGGTPPNEMVDKDIAIFEESIKLFEDNPIMGTLDASFCNFRDFEKRCGPEPLHFLRGYGCVFDIEYKGYELNAFAFVSKKNYEYKLIMGFEDENVSEDFYEEVEENEIRDLFEIAISIVTEKMEEIRFNYDSEEGSGH